MSSPFFIFASMKYTILILCSITITACTGSHTTPEEDAIQELTVDAMILRDSVRADSMMKTLLYK